MAPEGLAAAYAECERIVRDGDADRAVSVGFAPPERQKHLFALYAFHIETLRVRDLVSQPLPGEIRLQWWRDRLTSADDIEEAAQGSPVALALISTVRAFDLPVDAFDRYLEARLFDLYNDPMPSRTEFEAYAGETFSALMMLAAMVLDRASAPSVATAAGHVGVGETAVWTLRHEAQHRHRNQIYVPGDMLSAVGTTPAEWLAGEDKARLVREAMRALAREHTTDVSTRWAEIPRSLRPVFLPALLAASTLGNETEPVGPFKRLWTYWRLMRR
ncbi:phytoene/squalene synthase family protein [Aureimonas sp. AU40]|uniref:phytoene/squalene synthase family protein n=1 Tax=Aureimonas sp. AU40 TaxID=1637747 RepID=UPI000780406B|nr:phytoene/squalene synthase family protein [Aureimonas sp. AU40]